MDPFDKPRNARLVQAIDSVNEKFGIGAVILTRLDQQDFPKSAEENGVLKKVQGDGA
jgi:hypothetical protein